jgi:hypothetical protein
MQVRGKGRTGEALPAHFLNLLVQLIPVNKRRLEEKNGDNVRDDAAYRSVLRPDRTDKDPNSRPLS